MISFQFKPSRFVSLLADNANWLDQYLEYLNIHIVMTFGNGLIRHYPFYVAAQAILDNEHILALTGNLDADL